MTLIPVIHADTVPGNWPPPDLPPPPVASWTALVDKTKIPKIPVRNISAPCDPKDPYCTWTCYICTRPKTDFTYCPNKTDWALTYDDGPGPNTENVLSALDSKGVKATFFVIGSRVLQHADVLKKTVAAGHQIGVHTWSHTMLTTQSNEQIIAEIKWTEKIIKNVTGLTPTWMRPPAGDIDDRVRGILTQLGYRIALWNHDTFDWKSNADPTFDLNWITGNFSQWVHNTSYSKNGYVSLEHDLFNTSSSKIPAALDIVVGAGFNVKQLSNCLGDKKPYLEDVSLPASPCKAGSETDTAKLTSSGNSLIPKYLTEFIAFTILIFVVTNRSIF
ncbi:10409_t:CDS:2 [Acaulospora morrowiae]|uniref:10409_t:CDS:1 n=1 Tax=Acaulospora morrowiae TaxID=94023 RepID=A0A9N9GGE4_9GLOM|nr:10409_t:CDS:2 [Acaulospora morrowiae]